MTPCSFLSEVNSLNRRWCESHFSSELTPAGGECQRVRVGEFAAEDKRTAQLFLAEKDHGIAVWGVTPPVYDSSVMAMPRGIHIHIDKGNGSHKEITCERLLVTGNVHEQVLSLTANDAETYMASVCLGYEPVSLECPTCMNFVLDQDATAVTPSYNHVCNQCFTQFHTQSKCIANPVMKVKEDLKDHCVKRETRTPNRTLSLLQSEYPGGIRVWASNPAILWTFPHLEKDGLHVHCFNSSKSGLVVDATVRELSIDGIPINARMVRSFMGQVALPGIRLHLYNVECPECGRAHFDDGLLASIPHHEHRCERCRTVFVTSQPVICNPILGVLRDLHYRL